MTNYLTKLADAVGAVLGELGFVRFALLIVFLAALAVGMKFLDATVSVLERCARFWRGREPWARWSIAIIGVAVFWPAIRTLIPWWDAFLAVTVAFLVVLSVGGFVYGQRYDVHDSPWAAWAYHARVTVKRRGYGKALDTSTGKKKNRAVKMTIHPNHGDEIIARPGEGMSAQALVDEFNNGIHTSSLANQYGWDQVQGVSAFPLQDGTVLVRVAHDAKGEDPIFTTTQHWPGMEGR